MAEAVFMPKQGQSVETCIITQWFKKKGDKVEEGDILFTYETDKAAFEEEAKTAGILLDIFYDEGDEVPVLSNVAVIGQEGESVEEFRTGGEPAGEKEEEKPSEEPAPQETEKQVAVPKEELKDNGHLRISPRAKKMAAKNNIDLHSLNGSGPNGRIIVRDVEEKMKQPAPEEKAPEVTPSQKAAKAAPQVPGDAKPLSNIRKIIAKNMHASLQNSAQLTHHLTADVRKLMALRKEVKERTATENIPNITLNDMVCFAVIKTLIKLPEMNSHFLGDSIRSFSKVHLGMAVDTERGLMVPVLQNADDYSLKGLSNNLKTLALSCRTGKVDPELLQPETGTFTVSNLGAFGIEMFTPVLNLPQVGILGVNTITYRPADTGDGTIGFIPVIGLSLTYDHRAVDGAPASNFLRELKTAIENFDESID